MDYRSMVSLEIDQEIKEMNKMHNDRWLLWVLAIVLMPLVCIFLVGKPHEYVEDINNLPEPIQVSTSGWVVKYINWDKIYIDFLAEYEIKWRVLAKRSYSETLGGANARTVNKLWPRDFAIWWSFMWDEQNMDKIVWNEFVNRAVQPHIKWEYISRFTEKWGRDGIETKRSNNHPIWGNLRIRLLLKKIKVGDVIKMKWYLVYVHPEKWNWRWWPSSMVRDDNWCEIIYVTDIAWLREK